MNLNNLGLCKQAINNFILEQKLINENTEDTDTIQDKRNTEQFVFRTIAIIAIKLQIPKLIQKENIKEYVDIDKNIIGHFTQCPNCKEDIIVNKNTNFCQCCGQALKFE